MIAKIGLEQKVVPPSFRVEMINWEIKRQEIRLQQNWVHFKGGYDWIRLKKILLLIVKGYRLTLVPSFTRFDWLLRKKNERKHLLLLMSIAFFDVNQILKPFPVRSAKSTNIQTKKVIERSFTQYNIIYSEKRVSK